MMININQQQNQEQQEGTSLGMYMREFLDCIYWDQKTLTKCES